jgi:hypothetical protein
MATIISFLLSPQNLWCAKSSSDAAQELEATQLQRIWSARPLTSVPRDLATEPQHVNLSLINNLQRHGISLSPSDPRRTALIESLQRALASFPPQGSKIDENITDSATSSFTDSDNESDWDSENATDSFTDSESNESEREDNTEYPIAFPQGPGANAPVVQKAIEIPLDPSPTVTSSSPNVSEAVNDTSEDWVVIDALSPLHWFELPDEMRSAVLMFLSFPNLIRITEVCKRMRLDAMRMIRLHALTTIGDAKKVQLHVDTLKVLDELIQYFRLDQEESSDKAAGFS